jgi:hypothetical protein
MSVDDDKIAETNETVKAEIDVILTCLKSEQLKIFLSEYERLLLLSGNNELPFTYFGINFKNDKVDSVKFYAHFLGDMTSEEILGFIPTARDFLKFLPLRNDEKSISGRNAGIALEIKFLRSENEPHYGFFYHLKNNKESFDAVGFPAGLPQELKSDCLGVGINFEYRKNDTLRKQYYYFNKPENKAFFEKKFDVNLLQEVRLIEYAESDSFAKINAYGRNVMEIHSKAHTFSETERQIISCLNNRYGLINLGYGFYENKDVKSIYFFDGESNINPNYAAVSGKTFNVPTLNKMIND